MKFRNMKISSEGLDGKSAKFAPPKISHYYMYIDTMSILQYADDTCLVAN